MSTKPDSSLQQELHKAAGWGIAVGTLLAILGIVAIAVPLATAIAIGLLFGWLFILGGIIQMSYAFLTRSSGRLYGSCCWACFICWVGFQCCLLPASPL